MTEKTLVVSDLHDGHPVAHTGRLLRLLSAERYDRLILGGDLTDTDSCLSYEGRRLLCLLRSVSNARQVVVLPGNHDPMAGVLAGVVGAHSAPFYEWCEGGRRLCVTHGHRDPESGFPWDPFLGGYSAPTALGNQAESDLCFYAGALGRRLALWGHRLRRAVCNVRDSVRHGALDFAARREVDTVICGHSHYPEADGKSGYAPRYVNAGSWCQTRDTYVVVERGVARLEEFNR